MRERILAIDFGMRRFGLAVSDPLGVIALGLPTLERKNLASDLAALGGLIEQYSIGEVILGLPLSKSGAENAMSQRVAGFAEKLRVRVNCSVRLWDERLSSAEANRMLRGSGIGLERRKRAVDRVAATLILQNYLDWRGHEGNQAAETRDPR
ncbi:MAG: Holliday junction resolvase RuvX [Terriglobia bacterium]